MIAAIEIDLAHAVFNITCNAAEVAVTDVARDFRVSRGPLADDLIGRGLAQLAYAASLGRPERVLVAAATGQEYALRVAEVSKLLPGGSAACRRIAAVEPRVLAAAGRQEKAGLLVLGSDGRFRGGEGFNILLNELECPVVLVG